jgi:hypothetical protein
MKLPALTVVELRRQAAELGVPLEHLAGTVLQSGLADLGRILDAS